MPESKNQTAKPLVESFIGKIFPYVRMLELQNAELKQTNGNLLDRIVAITTGLSLDDRPLTAEQLLDTEKEMATVKTRRTSIDLSTELEALSLQKREERLGKAAETSPVGRANGNGATGPHGAA